jgi:hypothetical protein
MMAGNGWRPLTMGKVVGDFRQPLEKLKLEQHFTILKKRNYFIEIKEGFPS